MKKKDILNKPDVTFDDSCLLDKLLPGHILMAGAFCYELGLQGLSFTPRDEKKFQEVFRRFRLYLVSPPGGKYLIGD